MRVEQCIQLDGLPLDGTYSVRTVTTATPAAHDNESAIDGHNVRALTITVEGAVECNPGASVPGLKGVIEGMLYYQVRLARSLVCSAYARGARVYRRVRAVAVWDVSADRTPRFTSHVRHQSFFLTC